MSKKKKTKQNKATASGLQAITNEFSRREKQSLTVLVNKHTERDAVGVESV